MIKISTSILSCKDRIEAIKNLNNTKTDYIHIDVMDGIFVNNFQFPIEESIELFNYIKKPIDMHLMMDNPEPYINNLNNNKIEFVTIHIEINKDISKLIKLIKNKGYKVGLSLKPNTNIKEVIKYINNVDMILIMSVEPGYGGQKFNPLVINKIKDIKNIKKDIITEVDGGINDENIKKILPFTDIAVVGSYITKQDNYNKAINNLKN